MKTLLVGLALLGIPAPAALGDVSKDDVKELLRLGTPEEEIRSYVEARRPVLPLSADDLRHLRVSGASDALLVFLITPPVPPAVPPVTSSDLTLAPYGGGVGDEDYSGTPPVVGSPYDPDPYSPYPYDYPGFGFSFVVPFHDRHDAHHDFHHDPFRTPTPAPHPGGPVRTAPSVHGNTGGHAGMGGHRGHR